VYDIAPPGRLAGNDPWRRAACLRAIARALDAAGVVWAVRGAPGELLRWCRDRSPKDLDLWAPRDHAETVVAVLIRAGGIPTCARRGVAGRPGIGSAMFMFVEEDGRPIGTLDVSFGPPRAGVIELAAESDHVRDIQRPAGLPCFTGAAVLTELVLRRCARGKASDTAHIRYARRTWRGLPELDRRRFLEQVSQRFRPPTARLLERALADEDDFPWDRLRRRLLAGACLARPRLLAEYAIDKALFDRQPRQRSRYPGGSRPSGTTIAILGTDGTGKSSLVVELRRALGNFGLGAQDLYFGRVRGSALVSDSMRQRLERLTRATSIADSTAHAPRRISRGQRALRHIASYVYVIDYAARLVLRVMPLWAQGNVIIFDRYVYDLRIMPHASALAARLAELIAPRPRLLFFLDVDARVIAARRQERTLAEVLKQQTILREACTRIGAGTRYVPIESLASVNELARQLARAAIATAHRREIGTSAILRELLDDVAKQLSRPPIAVAPRLVLADSSV
jgi:thymidylate kinase